MRSLVLALLGGVVLVGGCAGHRGASASFSEVSNVNRPSAGWPGGQVIVTADNRLAGKVARVNSEGRFVVMTFPIGHLPALRQQLSIYRQGLKVGEIRVTGPQLDDSIVGDIQTGDAQAGDEVRAQ